MGLVMKTDKSVSVLVSIFCAHDWSRGLKDVVTCFFVTNSSWTYKISGLM